MRINILASGSKGNCTYVEIKNQKIMIDAGISLKQMTVRLQNKQIHFDQLNALYITHEHSDHTAGILTLYRKYQMEIYCSYGTYKNMNKMITSSIPESAFHFVTLDEIIDFDEYSVLPFMTFHDALEPTGYRFYEENKSFVYMTDTGYYPEQKFDQIRNADVYVIESNHEPDLLLDSDRPWVLKRRILDDTGHLSNEDSAYLMLQVLGTNTKKIILAHLSEECNTEEHAMDAYRRVFEKQGMIYDEYDIECAKQNEPMEDIYL